MNTLVHALWGATLGRTVGLTTEGAFFGALPDIPVPILAYYHRKGMKGIEHQPGWIQSVYKVFHNWWFGIALTVILLTLSPKLGLLGLAFLWHGIEDALVHDGENPQAYATRFLFPVWRKKFHGYSATHHQWIQLIDLALIGLINFLLIK